MAYKQLDAREADLRGEDKGNGTRSLIWCACIPQIWTRRQAIKQLQWARIRIERTGDRICISSLHYRSNIHSCVVWRRENDCVPAHRNPRQNKAYTDKAYNRYSASNSGASPRAVALVLFTLPTFTVT